MTDSAVYIIDAMNYIFRAYYALPDNITAPSGIPTNAVLGYLRTLLRIIKAFLNCIPKGTAFCVIPRRITWRSQRILLSIYA